MFVNLYGEEVGNAFRQLAGPGGLIRGCHAGSPIVGALTELHRKASQQQIQDVYQAANLAFGILMALYRTFQPGAKATVTSLPLPPEIEAAVHFIKTSYGTDLTIERIARTAKMSKYHFIRMFRAFTGATPLQYVNRVRISVASELLRSGQDLNVNQIAERVGYATGNYFIKVFHKMTGQTPRQYAWAPSLFRGIAAEIEFGTTATLSTKSVLSSTACPFEFNRVVACRRREGARREIREAARVRRRKGADQGRIVIDFERLVVAAAVWPR